MFALAGVTFTLQGLGVVGPASSFMFRSTAWVVQGLAVFLIGLLLILAGFWLGRTGKTG